MASIQPRGEKFRALVFLQNVRDSRTFDSRTEARSWATTREAEILAGVRGDIPDKLFGEALGRYALEISPTKEGERWERIRLAACQRDPIALVNLRELSGKHVAEWRDRRKAVVSGSSVRREWNLLGSVCSVAVAEWKWLKENPFAKEAGVSRPKAAAHRDELIDDRDLAALRGAVLRPPHARVLRAADFAIETAMRSGEIIYIGYNPEHVDTSRRVAHLPKTKNGTARDVPLSMEAVRLWFDAQADHTVRGDDSDSALNVWGLTDATRDLYWREVRNTAAKTYPPVARLHFHDTRHTAITRLAKKLQVMDLARMTGHRNINELLTYYNESAESIAQKL